MCNLQGLVTHPGAFAQDPWSYTKGQSRIHGVWKLLSMLSILTNCSQERLNEVEVLLSKEKDLEHKVQDFKESGL